MAVLDTETTGLTSSDRVLSIAVVILDRSGAELDAWYTLVNPLRAVAATEIHGITDEDVQGAPTFPEVFPRLLSLLQGSLVVAHNAPFDLSILQAEAQRASLSLEGFDVVCSLEASRPHLSLPSLSLSSLAAHFGVPLKPHHALEDARALAALLPHLDAASQGAFWGEACAPEALLSRPRSRSRRSSFPPAYKSQASFQNPGLLLPGAPLVQGMSVAFTGGSKEKRTLVPQIAAQKGLTLANSVSAKTSLLVAGDPGSTSGKAARARSLGVPILSFEDFLALLPDTLPGEPLDG